MTKNSIHSKIEEIKNFEEHSNELMEEIFKGNVDWEMTEDGNYKKGNQIINSNNFSPEQNKKLKDRFSYFQSFQKRGREGRIKETVTDDYEFVAWLRDEKNKDNKKIATKGLDLNELRKLYQQKLQEGKADTWQAKIEIIPGRSEK